MTAAKGVLRLALIQANPTVGAIEANLALALKHCESNRDADLVVFPECFASGYPLEDLVLRPGFLSRLTRAIDGFADAVRKLGGPAVLIGAPVAGTELPYNAAYFITPDGTVRTVLKTELPNIDVFDERRVFAQGQDPKPLDLKGWRLGAMICEDMWHGRVTRALADELVDILIVINGSPFEVDKMPVRLAHARERVRASGKPLVYLNMVGGQDELVLDGGSFVLDAEGEIVAQMPAFAEATLRLELTRIRSWAENGSIEIDNIEQAQGEIVPYPDSLESIYAACTLGLRDYIEKNGFPQAMLGVSGGLDSALVAALAVDAIGPDRVVGVMMPTRFTGHESLELAEDLFRRLGCRHGVAPIGAMFDAYEKTLDEIGPGLMGTRPSNAARSMASENFQPRTRGALLMALSNAYGGLVLSTGNKSEMSVGYATLYGDMCGGFNPIKDLYKTTAFELCRWRNQNHRDWMRGGRDPIPQGIIDRPPTAELKPDQTDEAALGSYEVLDTILRLLIEHLLEPAEALRQAERQLGITLDSAYVKRIASLVKSAEYKRRQAPPGIKLTGRPFGKGWRYPMTNRASL
ncbi:MAG TPA: NAD+ synthase [Hypericibacter adhaerens]|uniref:NAD+ synthase n=1 Tax=Hypericibacter adhaerens TaxID=2602016 RepID=UPI002B932A76|nr:NAD+ synthase [Hypericibacter adhaerens]HWA41607.1 NAD+ synthase [Hypericibacter adhaerens]